MRVRSQLLGLVLGALCLSARAQPLVAERLPDPGIAGYRFPEREAVLTQWVTEASRGVTPDVRSGAAARLALHGWGLWTALTAESRQFSEGQRLRIFETWVTPDDLAGLPDDDPAGTTAARGRRGGRRRTALQGLGQFAPRPAVTAGGGRTPAATEIDRIAGFTKFDPVAADHAARQRLLNLDTLNLLLSGGAQQVTPFPAAALVVKPAFQVIHTRDLVAGRYYALKVWSGPPAVAMPYPPAMWPAAVWVDVAGGGRGGAVESPPVPNGSARTEATTYPLGDFISYRLSAEDAAGLNRAKPGTDAAPGDIALLVALHASTRELARWTWHTYWWTPTPEDPRAPSSTAIAAARPPELRGAPRHYAMALGHAMLSPNEPYLGGDNRAPAVYVYNPYIEARFAPADLPDSQPGLDPAGRPAANNTGVQTNCLSCHIQATHNPNKAATAPRFTGARYVDLGAAEFTGTLQTDFLWALTRHAQPAPAATTPTSPVLP